MVPDDELIFEKCEKIQKGWKDVQAESNQVTIASGVIVKGGKKEKRPPCMRVQDRIFQITFRE